LAYPGEYSGAAPCGHDADYAAATRWCCEERDEPPPLLVEPAEVGLAPGATQQFTATRGGVPVDVTWEATGGTISATGLYTAGEASGRFEVIARGQPLAPGDPATAFATVVISGPGRVVPVRRASRVVRFDEDALFVEDGFEPTLLELRRETRPFEPGGSAGATARAESTITLDAEETVLELRASGSASFDSLGPNPDAAFFANHQNPLSSFFLEFDVVGAEVQLDLFVTFSVDATGPCPASNEAVDCQAHASAQVAPRPGTPCNLAQHSRPNASNGGANGTFARACERRRLQPGRYTLAVAADPEGTREPGAFSMSASYDLHAVFTP
jgi:hypothetical protein